MDSKSSSTKIQEKGIPLEKIVKRAFDYWRAILPSVKNRDILFPKEMVYSLLYFTVKNGKIYFSERGFYHKSEEIFSLLINISDLPHEDDIFIGKMRQIKQSVNKKC